MNVSTASSPANGSTSAPSTLHICLDCSCPNTQVDRLISDARLRITNHNRRYKSHQVDTEVFIVADEYGRLMTGQGDLSFVMPSAPVLDKLTAPQLNEEIREAYEQTRLAAWDLDMPEPESLFVNDRQIFIIPTYVDNQRFAMTMFGEVAKTQKVAA